MNLRHVFAPDAQSFDHFATSYDRRDELDGGWITDWLAAVVADRAGESAVELGCGTGRVAALLADRYDHVRAVDLSAEMIDLARSNRPHPRVTYEQLDLRQVTGQYDLVVSIMTLHHVLDLPATLDHIRSLVAPGGAAILVDAAQPARSRWMFYFFNVVTLAKNLARRDRNAFERFRLNSDRRWIDHKVSDRFLLPAEFVATYGRAFPGAVIKPVSGLHTAVWQHP